MWKQVVLLKVDWDLGCQCYLGKCFLEGSCVTPVSDLTESTEAVVTGHDQGYVERVLLIYRSGMLRFR